MKSGQSWLEQQLHQLPRTPRFRMIPIAQVRVATDSVRTRNSGRNPKRNSSLSSRNNSNLSNHNLSSLSTQANPSNSIRISTNNNRRNRNFLLRLKAPVLVLLRCYQKAGWRIRIPTPEHTTIFTLPPPTLNGILQRPRTLLLLLLRRDLLMYQHP